MWTWGNQFVIKDEHDNPAYRVVGKVFSWGDSLSFQDSTGVELARIEQRLFKLMPQYEIRINGQLFAEVLQEWSWFKKRFTLDVPGPNDYTITGSFWEYEFTFERQGETVAKVSKKYFTLGDTYGVDIFDDENQLAILSTVVVVDLVCAKRRHSAANS